MKRVGASGAAPVTPAGAAEVLGEDAASDLTVVRVPPARVPPLETWSPRRLEAPRYLLSTDVVSQRVAWRPVYVGGLVPEHSPRWQDDVWIAPSKTDLTPGAFVFTVDGAWAGMAVNHRGLIAIAPPDVVMARAEGAIMSGRQLAATLGVDIARLTAPLAAAAGAESGVIVTWVDPAGPAAGQLAATDVIETVDSVRLHDVDEWDARVRRLVPGHTLELGGRRRGTSFTTRLIAAAAPAAPVTDGLGLVLRVVRGSGASVVSVQPGSAAARAGIQAGDTLSAFDGVIAPTPAQVERAYDASAGGRAMLVGVRRGDVHLVLALER
jgi:S1-C subfamily serine protease